MGTERPTNEKIHIGDIFQESLVYECGSRCWFYQVVGLRGKTLVEVREIKTELFQDEACLRNARGEVKVRPLPGQFKNEEVITLSVRSEASDEIEEDSRISDRNCLRERGRRNGCYYYQVLGDEVGRMTGYDAHYALKALEREGRLPGSC